MLSPLAKIIVNYARNRMIRENSDRLKLQKLPEGIKEVTDLNYAGDDDIYHELDIYYPPDVDETTPTLIEIHGGAFIYGDKELNKVYAYHLAKLGFVVVNLSYRLAPEVQLIGQLQDISKAFAWVKVHGKKYNLNLKNVFLTGDSAGAYLALLSTAINNSKEIANAFDTKPANLDLKAIGLVSCVYDVTKSITAKALRSVLFPKNIRDLPYKDYLEPEKLFQKTTFPPIWIATSDEDFMKHDSLTFYNFLKKRGHIYKFVHARKRPNIKLGHVFCVSYPEYAESEKVNSDMAEFLSAHRKDNKNKEKSLEDDKEREI